MSKLSVSLTVDLQRHINSRVAAEGFADPADYLRDLVQRDRCGYRADVARVEAMIDEGVASGIVNARPEDLPREIVDGPPTATHG